MWILDQAENNIINCDKVMNIGIEEISTLDNIVAISAQADGYTVFLGKYESNRAITVLEDIVYMIQMQNDDVYYEKQRITERQIYNGYEKQHKDNVFKMPKE